MDDVSSKLSWSDILLEALKRSGACGADLLQSVNTDIQFDRISKRQELLVFTLVPGCVLCLIVSSWFLGRQGDTIENRPKEVAERETFGHWEMDSVMGCRWSKAALVTMIERVTRMPAVLRVPDHTMESVVRELNGKRIIRRFFPKGINIDAVSAPEVAAVQDWLADYPRKILGWQATDRDKIAENPVTYRPR